MSAGPYSDAELGVDPEQDARDDARGDTAPGFYSEPPACTYCNGGGNHCPECSDEGEPVEANQ